MCTRDVRIRSVENAVLSNALKDINAMMKEIDNKIDAVFKTLDEEMQKLDSKDEAAIAMDEIMIHIVNEFPERVCFMNELYSIASNASSDYEYEEEETTEEESEEEDD